MKTLLLMAFCASGILAGTKEWNRFCNMKVCNHCRSYLVRVMNPIGDKHYLRCSIITTNNNCCQYDTDIRQNLFTDRQCKGAPTEQLMEVYQKTVQIENCGTEQQNQTDLVTELDEVFDNFDLDNEVCPKSSTDCLDLSGEIKTFQDKIIQFNTTSCSITYKEMQTCGYIIEEKYNSDLITALTYASILLLGALFGAGVVAAVLWKKKDNKRLKTQLNRRRSLDPVQLMSTKPTVYSKANEASLLKDNVATVNES